MKYAEGIMFGILIMLALLNLFVGLSNDQKGVDGIPAVCDYTGECEIIATYYIYADEIIFGEEESLEDFINASNLSKGVYYDKKINRFVDLRENFDGGWIVGIAKYYGDSKTTISTAPISNEYILENLEYVHDVEKYATYTGYGWSTEYNNLYEGLEGLVVVIDPSVGYDIVYLNQIT